MDPEPGITFTQTVMNQNIIRLLEANAVSVVIAHHAVLDHRAEPAIEENAAAPAPIEVHILFLIAVDGQVFDMCAFEIVAADNWKDSRRLCLVAHHAIRIERSIDGESISILSGNATDRCMKPA